MRYPTKKMSILLAGLLILMPAIVNAAVYQVELIIFSHVTAEGTAQEQWPTIDPKEYHFSNAILLKNRSDPQDYYTLLPNSRFVLNREASLLNKNPAYHVLAHVAWKQPVQGQRHAPWVRLSSQQVNGVLRVSVEHYLNVSFNLLLTATGDPAYFHFSEYRRMRSNELNYIDSPLYGVLIKIVPV